MTKKKEGAVIGRPPEGGDTGSWVGRLGLQMRTARIKKGVTLRALAEKSGVEMTLISDFERGRRDISLSDMFRICSAIGVDPSKLAEPKNEVDGSLIGSMSVAWVAEVCALLGRSVGTTLTRIRDIDEVHQSERKRNRVKLGAD